MAEPPNTPAQLAAELESQPGDEALTNMPVELGSPLAPITLHSFLDLPTELKEKIYEYALQDGEHIDKPPRFRASVQWPRLPALCYTSKHEHNIASMVLVRNAGLYLAKDNDADSIQRWLKNINGFDKTGLAAVKKAEVRYEPRNGRSNAAGDVQFLSKCPGLHELTLGIPYEFWHPRTIDYEKRDMTFHNPPTLDQLVDQIQLANVQGCGGLKVLNIHVLGLMTDRVLGPGTPMWGEELAHWIMDNHESTHGRDLLVNLIHHDIQEWRVSRKSAVKISKAYPSSDGRLRRQEEDTAQASSSTALGTTSGSS